MLAWIFFVGKFKALVRAISLSLANLSLTTLLAMIRLWCILVVLRKLRKSGIRPVDNALYLRSRTNHAIELTARTTLLASSTIQCAERA